MRRSTATRAFALAIGLLAAPATTLGSHDLKVDGDSITGPGEHALELHANVSRPSENDPNREHRALRLMTEYPTTPKAVLTGASMRWPRTSGSPAALATGTRN